jgi:L-arabinose isomerase
MTAAAARTALTGREVWFLTGSQHLYGDETLRQVAAQSRDIAEALGAAPDIPVRVAWQPVLTDPDEIRRLILRANDDDNVIGLIAWMHTFSPAKMWIAGLSALGKPLLHLHTQANVTLPWSAIDMDFMNLNQAAHGDREFGYIQTRLGVRRKTVAGHVSDPRVVRQVATWTRAAAGWAATRSLKLARFGDNMRFVAVTEGDKTEAEAVFGVQVNTWSVNELASAVASVSAADVDTLVDEYQETYDVAPELRTGKERHQSLRDGAAIELGLRSFLGDGGFGAFTTNFEDLGALKQLPGLAVQRLMADGYGFGAEGDWKTAVLVRAAKVMGAGLPGGASLMEDYTYDLTPGRERILGAHMLEVCPSLTATTPRLEVHPLAIGGREDPVRLVFTADPGPGVVVALSDMRDRFRMVANVVDVVPPSEPLPRLPVGRAVWQPAPDFRTSAASWLQAGAAHHTCMSTAVGIEAFADYARMAGTELLVIDETTTMRSFENEIRWNAAYYRLARGILRVQSLCRDLPYIG